MKPTKFSSSSSLFIICLCLVSYDVVPALGLKLYENLCSETRKYSQDCLDLLKRDKRIVASENYHELSVYILDFAIKEAKSYEVYLVGKAKKFPNDQAVKICATQLITTTVAAFESSFSDLDKDLQTSIADAVSAGIGADKCDKAIQNEKPEFDPKPIHTRNNEMLLLSVISVLAINHLT
ncbi:plant invertase/pectin methylesterase inhibitor protein [Medicago truncatula]|uniref:Plant invertase/pectin methylesterase inhibitor protein n=2 Tax=Medicago truncatula TaxID=3880 RepID=A0A072UA22_MEDTR|nr:plant invertase/pectin methylesterase inhibitor protein [Medicago truncatula]